MNIIKPKKLKHGDTIEFIAPSGCVDEDKILNAKSFFEAKGFKVKLSENIFAKDRYMAGSDEQRLTDLHNAFLDKNVDAIICARGGYGALRLISKIDYNLIKTNPKIFCGYSDITVLSAMIYKNTGLITFSSPMPKGDFQTDELDNYTVKSFFDTLTGDNLHISPVNSKIYSFGNAKGVLVGGNLSTFASLCGVDFLPDEDLLFFTEDLNEPIYKIDKYFRQLLNVKKFKNNLKAILLGDFLDIDYPDLLFKELAKELNIPIISGYKFSHSKSKCTVPYGAKAILEDTVISFQPVLE